MIINMDSPFVGIRVKGLNHYLWFEKGTFDITPTHFQGKDGWGKGGANTSISCQLQEIKSVIHSEEAQYI